MWVADASFLKLRTFGNVLQASGKAIEETGFLGGAKIFARAHDLFCIDGIDIRDPEAIGASHPTMTQYAFGFNLSF